MLETIDEYLDDTFNENIVIKSEKVKPEIMSPVDYDEDIVKKDKK